MSRIKFKILNFFWNFGYFIKYELFSKLFSFLDNYKLYLLSIVFAVAGLIASFENVTWLMIVGGILSYIIRSIRFHIDFEFEEGSWNYYYHLPLWTKSTITLLIVSVIGMMPIHFLLEKSYFTSFLLSFNASLLLFYVFWGLFLLVRFTRFKLYQHKEMKEFLKKEKEKEEDYEV